MNELILISIGVVLFGVISQLLQKPTQTETKKNYGKLQYTVQGEVVRSFGEKVIADYLHSVGVVYEYEPKMFGLRPDFYIGHNTIIEYWGMARTDGIDGNKYRQSMIKKLEIYKKNKLNVISIFDFEISDHSFKQKIGRELSRLW